MHTRIVRTTAPSIEQKNDLMSLYIIYVDGIPLDDGVKVI